MCEVVYCLSTVVLLTSHQPEHCPGGSLHNILVRACHSSYHITLQQCQLGQQQGGEGGAGHGQGGGGCRGSRGGGEQQGEDEAGEEEEDTL